MLLVVATIAAAPLLGAPETGISPFADKYAPQRPTERSQQLSPRLESAHAIPDAETWSRLAARPASETIARTEVVKFLVDLATDRTVWFVDSERYQFHYDFAQAKLSSLRNPVPELEVFNVREYRRPERRFEMGSIVHYLDPDLWTFEMVGGDNLPGDRVLSLYRQLSSTLWLGKKLRYRPVSDLHTQLTASVGDQLHMVSTEEVFAGVRYQPLTTGKTCGFLRIVRGPLDSASVRADQILVLEQLPEEIPVSAAVISQSLQAPLGHIAILCETRGTPNMGLRGALTQPDLTRLEGKLIELVVGNQDYSLREVSRAEAEKDWQHRQPKRPQIPKLKREPTALIDVADLSLRDADFAGAKAAQLGQVARLGKPINTPGGFVIPVAHYLEQLRSSGVEPLINELCASDKTPLDAHARDERLAAVRAKIEAKEINDELLAHVHGKMRSLAPAAKWILRSSTNAEDLAGFSGAGLYRSVVVKAGATPAEVAKAIREVWSSVWLLGAFDERAWYRVDHRTVAMAILVQPFVDGAVANGVAITANPFSEARPGILVNIQARGGSVTGARGDEIPEQVLIYTYSEQIESEVLSRSSRNGGAPLLGEKQMTELATILKEIHDDMVPRWGKSVNAVDVEFLLAGDDAHVVIVQARPYTVKYGPGQRLE